MLTLALTNILKHALRNAFLNASEKTSLRVELRRRPGIISIWIIRRQNVSTYVRRWYRNNKIGKGLKRCVARVNGGQAEREREREIGGGRGRRERERIQQRRSIGRSTSKFSRTFEGNESEKRQKERRKGKERERGRKGRDRESYYEQRLRARN